MPVLVGGLSLASGVLGSFGAAGGAKAQAIAQKMQQDQINFQNKWQNEAQNRNLLRQWGAQQQINMQLEQAANQQYATQNVYLKMNYQNAASMQSKQTKQTTDQFLAVASARGVSQDSASAKAILRQATIQSANDSRAAATSFAAMKESIKTEEKNILSQRRLGGPEQSTFIASTGGIVDASSNALMSGLAQAALGSFSSAYSARQQNIRDYGDSSWFSGVKDLFK